MSEKAELCLCRSHAHLVHDLEKGWKVVCFSCGRQSDGYTKKQFAVKAWNSLMTTMREAEK